MGRNEASLDVGGLRKGDMSYFGDLPSQKQFNGKKTYDCFKKCKMERVKSEKEQHGRIINIPSCYTCLLEQPELFAASAEAWKKLPSEEKEQYTRDYILAKEKEIACM